MRIMYDTNVLLSALVLRSKVNTRALIIGGYEGNVRLLSSFVIDEVFSVIKRKWPNKANEVYRLFSVLSFERVELPTDYPRDLFPIRDPWDYPVIYSAYIAHADYLVTGDKDFQEVTLPHTQIVAPRQIVDLYV